MYHLVVGGSSVAGQCSLQALAQLSPNDPVITTASTDKSIDGCTSVIEGIDLHKPGAIEDLVEQLPANDSVGALVFCPAFGAVGFPIEEASEQQIQEAVAFCVESFDQLARSLRPNLAVGFSAFYWLPACQAGYGAMAYAKLALEQLALKYPNQFRIIRAGLFKSRSSKAIALLLHRTLKTSTHPMAMQLRDEWKTSGKKLLPFFEEHVLHQEAQLAGKPPSPPHKVTTAASLERALVTVLQGTANPFYNVVGDTHWETNRLPQLPRCLRLET